jgi:hypothetical protein
MGIIFVVEKRSNICTICNIAPALRIRVTGRGAAPVIVTQLHFVGTGLVNDRDLAVRIDETRKGPRTVRICVNRNAKTAFIVPTLIALEGIIF